MKSYLSLADKINLGLLEFESTFNWGPILTKSNFELSTIQFAMPNGLSLSFNLCNIFSTLNAVDPAVLSKRNVGKLFSSFHRSLPSIMPHSLNDQFRRMFSQDRSFKGGFEATSGIFVAIYYHVLIPGN